MHKIKVLYLSHSSTLNGGEISLLTLLKNLDRDRVEPLVVLPGEGPLCSEIEALGIRMIDSSLDRWIRYSWDHLPADGLTTQRVARLVEIIQSEQIDIVHSNSSVIHEGGLGAKLAGVRHVWHIHETLTDHPELVPLLDLPLILHGIDYLSDAVVTVANTVQQQFRDVGVTEKLRTVYNGIDSALFDKLEGSSIRDELRISRDKILVVSVGAVTERKGYPHLLKAAEIICGQRSDVHFLWVGPLLGKERPAFEEAISNCGLQDVFTHLDFRRDIPQILKFSDLYVLPSLNEAFPLVILEAMAAGKPVVATCCGGTSESVEDGNTGYLVPVANSEALAEKILVLASNQGLREAMGQRGREVFERKFSAETYARRMEELYEHLLSSPMTTDLSGSVENILFQGAIQTYETLTTRIEELRIASESLQAAQRSCGHLQAKVEEAQDRLADRDRRLADLVDQVAERERAIQERDHLLAESRGTAQTLKQDLTATQGELAQANIRVKALEERLRQTESILAAERKGFDEEKTKNANERKAECLRHEEKLSEIEKQINEILNSKSWKVTAPLRKAGSFLTRK
ncbi:MAG: hypothetical protein CVU69_02640 [Deltaproteobacteria bacterium HGW-Deltaproteobacteria-4]|nr:MAG: hypothetical protein CVU69_02640 [Deltaproteobacteria bacterium HGW-Deltaproteobacteria-4]